MFVLQRFTAKSPLPNVRLLLLQAATHRTSPSNNIPFDILVGIGFGPACFP